MTSKESPRSDLEHVAENKSPPETPEHSGKRKKRKKLSKSSDVPNTKRKVSHSHPPKAEPLAFDFRITEPNARDAVFHGLTSLKLPLRKEVSSLPQEGQHKYIQGVTEVCEKLIQLLDETVLAFSKNEDGLGVEEQLMSDMARLKNIPIARRYVEMTLWRRVKLFSRERLEAAEELGYGNGKKEKGDGFLLHPSGGVDPNFVSYRDAYLKTVIERYQDELDKIRVRESLDAERVESLLQCLQSGADLFANLKCFEDKEAKRKPSKSSADGYGGSLRDHKEYSRYTSHDENYIAMEVAELQTGC
ncbi:hypothetical protein FGB62_166g055 [Gracilaria domingensis]|nr:hypothetical protein FGB62_166g055 [Gracilaria domingensis]